MYYQENEKRLILEKNLEGVLEEKKTLEVDLTQKEKTITQLNQSLKDLQLEYGLKLEQKETELTNLTQELEKIEEERGSLKSDFSKLKDMRQLLEQRLNQLTREKEGLQRRLTELEEKNKSLLARLGDSGETENQLTLEKIVIQQSPAWEGEVLAVDNEFGYAVIGLGMKKGLPENVLLGIFRGKENIGQGQVVKLYENTAVMKIIKQDREILENDIVKNIEEK